MEKKRFKHTKKTQHKLIYFFLTFALTQAGARAPTTQHGNHFRLRAGHNGAGTFSCRTRKRPPRGLKKKY